MSEEKEKLVEFLVDQAERSGVSVGRVDDGHVFIMMKSFVQRMLSTIEKKGNDRIVVFVQREDRAPPKGEAN